jgi:hypothetical protein
VCRSDELLVHTSGEMTNPLPWEQQIVAACPAHLNAVCVVVCSSQRPNAPRTRSHSAAAMLLRAETDHRTPRTPLTTAVIGCLMAWWAATLSLNGLLGCL